MKKPKISLIAAIAENRALGKNNDLIYKIPEDLKRFKEITKGHPIIMGRKTFESIGRPLSNRTNIVISRDPNFSNEGVMAVHSLERALKVASGFFVGHPELVSGSSNEIFIIGGGQIFQESIGLADKLYLTVVEDDPEADVFFPNYSEFTKIVSREDHKTDSGLKYRFLTLEKP